MFYCPTGQRDNHRDGNLFILLSTAYEVSSQVEQECGFARPWFAEDQEFLPSLVKHLCNGSACRQWSFRLLRCMKEQPAVMLHGVGLFVESERQQRRTLQRLSPYLVILVA
jgi:hypothetical protein